VPHEQPFRQVGAPAVDQPGDLSGDPAPSVRSAGHQPGRAEHGRVHQREQDGLLHQVAGHDGGQQPHGGVHGDRARHAAAEAQGVEIEVLPRHEDHVAQQDEARRESRAGDQQRHDQREHPRRPRGRVRAQLRVVVHAGRLPSPSGRVAGRSAA
jgi:hypothetical protein